EQDCGVSHDLWYYCAARGSFSRVGEFSRGIPAFQRLRLAVFHDELEDDVGKLRDPELQALVGDELLFGLAGEEEEEAAVLLQDDLELRPRGGLVGSRELFDDGRVERLGPARETDLGFVERHQ